MKTIDTIQNTDEWYKLRNTRLGASNSNIIMGQSKFMTPLELWKIKTGEVKQDSAPPNYIQAKGHRMEEKMRAVMEMLYDTELPSIVVLSEQYDFLMCSLDGYSEKFGFNWECKYVGQADYDKVAEGEMLMHYYPQIQHQLMLTGAPFCLLTVVADNKESQTPDFPYKYAYMEVKPDHEYMKNQLLPKLVEFWEMVKSKISPEIGDKDTVDLSENEDLIQNLTDYSLLKDQMDADKVKLDDLHKKIFKSLGKAKKAVCNGVKITQSKSEDKSGPDYVAYLKEKYNISDEYIISEGFEKITKGRVTKRITFPKVSV